MNKILKYALCSVFIILIGIFIYFMVKGKTNQEKSIKLLVNVDVPVQLSPDKMEISYEIGYGRKNIESVIEKDTQIFENLSKVNVQSVEVDILDAKKLDYSKDLLIIYNANLSYGDGFQLLKGGGGNYINLSKLNKKLKRIELYVGYNKENKSLSFRPGYSFK